MTPPMDFPSGLMQAAQDALPAPAEDTPELGQQLKALRQARGWTLEVAARHSGMSLSALSKIERGALSPTIGSLRKIAAGFGIDVVTLLSRGTQGAAPGRRSVNRLPEGVAHATGTCQNTWLATDLTQKRMQPFRTRVTARRPEEYAEWARHPGEIFVYVLKGAMVLHSEAYAPLRLRAGESVYYDASMGSKWTSEGEDDAEVLWLYSA